MNDYGLELQSLFSATNYTKNAMPCAINKLRWKWVPCAAHVLQLCIKHTLKVDDQIKSGISLVHQIYKFTTHGYHHKI